MRALTSSTIAAGSRGSTNARPDLSISEIEVGLAPIFSLNLMPEGSSSVPGVGLGSFRRLSAFRLCRLSKTHTWCFIISELNAGLLKDVLYLEGRTLPAALAIRVISSSTARFSCLSVFTFPVSASTLIAPVLKSAPDSWYSR